MHALEPYTGEKREKQIGSFFGIDIAIGAIITAVAGAISGAAGVLGLAAIISAPIATALATTFVTGLVATLSGLIAQIPSEIQKAFNGSFEDLAARAEAEIRKAKPDWPDGRVKANAIPFAQSVTDVTMYLTGAIDRPTGWAIHLPKRLRPGTLTQFKFAYDVERLTKELIGNPAGAGSWVTQWLAKYVDTRPGSDSEESDRINRENKTGKYADVALAFDDPNAPPPKVLTPEENFAAIAKSITDAGGKLVGDTSSWDFSKLPSMPTLGPDTSAWERVDWSIAPFMTRDQRTQLALAAVDAYPNFGHGMMGYPAKNPFLGNRVAEYAGLLVDPASSPTTHEMIRYSVLDLTSAAGAAINAAQRAAADSRARASAAQKGAAAALSVVAKPATVTVNAKGAVVVTKPKPTFASFVWGTIYGSR